MNHNKSSNSKVIVRKNIADHVSQTKEGGLYLHKNPLPYDEKGMCVSPEKERVLDLVQLLTLLGVPSPVDHEDLYKICELVLLREEANSGSMFNSGARNV